jgi:hypothetical protein
MKLNSTFNEAWKANPDSFACMIGRYPPKSILKIDGPNALTDEIDYSPHAEAKRISDWVVAGMVGPDPRLGVITYRSGGNWAAAGTTPPGSGIKTGGQAAFYEHEQSIVNAHNYSLEVTSDRQTQVSYFITGDLLHKNYKDPALRMVL